MIKCEKCGNLLEDGFLFCNNCGAKLENMKGQEKVKQEAGYTSLHTFEEHQAPTMQSGLTPNKELIPQQPQKNNQPEKKKDGCATASLILGIISLILSFILNVLTLPLSLVGLVLGIVAKKGSKNKIVGIILNSISMVVSIIVFIILVFILKAAFFHFDFDMNIDPIENTSSTFSGKGYTIEYTPSKWSKATLTTGEKALQNKNSDFYFSEVGNSTYDESFTCDFFLSSCKERVYEEFYEFWTEDLKNTATFQKALEFELLKGDIYYATYQYFLKDNTKRGYFYLIVSEDKNTILSFMTNKKEDLTQENKEDVYELLEKIQIEKQEKTTTTEEDENTLEDYLNDLSPWNMYSYIRVGNTATKKVLEGEYRLLGVGEEYWKFTEKEFYFYESYKTLEDDYISGEYEVKKGSLGLKEVGIEETKVDDIIKQSNNTITENDIYTVILTPKKMILNGVEQSDLTNVLNQSKRYVWILIDHGQSGIEAQVLNVDSATNSYYVKMKD